ncbi:hypothetical protein OK18_13125 [Chryseobacterium gallinarum]|uniref:Uncharacterized protein n=1 Tax=Chryseobacterium gallinarum TaxID=1324352 RepID=A0A0G3M5V3_CHRGL|nr:hypothetical protein OK18_13125 [Chryseobacterium gallinarum]
MIKRMALLCLMMLLVKVLARLATADVQKGFATVSESGGTRDFGVNIKLDKRLPALQSLQTLS